MMVYLKNLMRLPGLYSRLQGNLKFQKKFLNKTLVVDIAESKKTNDDSLSDKDYLKITNYYGLAVPAVLGESFCVLRGRDMTEDERMALSYLGGLTGLFDDFFDEKGMTEEHILQLISNTNNPVFHSSHEKLFIDFYSKALENTSDKSLLMDYFTKVYEAQVLSKKQVSGFIDSNEIKSITYEKGGISLLFYRCALDGKMDNMEKLLLYKLGGLMQLENDIFDIYKDNAGGIKTLPTTETQMGKVRDLYKSLVVEVFDDVLRTSYSPQGKKAFNSILSMILCRGFVCLDMLECLQEKTNGVFSIEKYDRKDLICDMEKPVNILKTINYFAKYTNS
ncbi:MAG: hypothetical protein GXO88_10460 [Chlorobi bacterium]|nr:hypothetical protein [Chlorobiota bacterium]